MNWPTAFLISVLVICSSAILITTDYFKTQIEIRTMELNYPFGE